MGRNVKQSHQAHVLLPAMIVSANDVAFAALVPGAFDPIGRRDDAQNEILGEYTG